MQFYDNVNYYIQCVKMWKNILSFKLLKKYFSFVCLNVLQCNPSYLFICNWYLFFQNCKDKNRRTHYNCKNFIQIFYIIHAKSLNHHFWNETIFIHISFLFHKEIKGVPNIQFTNYIYVTVCIQSIIRSMLFESTSITYPISHHNKHKLNKPKHNTFCMFMVLFLFFSTLLTVSINTFLVSINIFCVEKNVDSDACILWVFFSIMITKLQKRGIFQSAFLQYDNYKNINKEVYFSEVLFLLFFNFL